MGNSGVGYNLTGRHTQLLSWWQHADTETECREQGSSERVCGSCALRDREKTIALTFQRRVISEAKDNRPTHLPRRSLVKGAAGLGQDCPPGPAVS